MKEGIKEIDDCSEKNSDLAKLGKEIRKELYVGMWLDTNRRLTEALRLIREGKEDPRSHYFLAIHYKNGWGVGQNSVLALMHYKAAAELGHAGACYELGLAYLLGNSTWHIAKDINKAYEFAVKKPVQDEKRFNEFDDNNYKQRISLNQLNDLLRVIKMKTTQEETNYETVPKP